MVDMLKGIWNDLTFAARTLAKAPAFTFVCILSLGIGMVPVIAVPYLARIPRLPPPGVDTQGMVEVFTKTSGSRSATNSWSYADYRDLRNADTGISLFAWATAPNAITLPDGRKTSTWPMYVSTDYFKVLGVRLARGSGFASQAADEAAVVVGHQFWQNNLNSDPEVIGKILKLDNVPYVVAGVAPELFEGHLGVQGRELFVPLSRYPLLVSDKTAQVDRSKEWLHLHGRLAHGVSVAQANTAVAGITARLAKEYPATNALKAGAVEPYDPLGVLDRSRFRVLEALGLALTGAVLMVVCLNISGMMQVRSAMREKELSIRQAIGASRSRLARHLFAEAVLLAAVAATLASLLLFNAPSVVSRLTGLPIPVQLQAALTVDFSMLAICAALCFSTSLVFGFLPALRFSRPVIITALKDDAGTGGMRVGRVQRFTAALQVAIAVPLLVLGGISLDRFRSTATSNLGFESHLLYAAPLELDASGSGSNRSADDIDFQIRNLRDNLARASGVASVTVADGMPLDFRGRVTPVSLETKPNEAPVLIHSQVTRVGGDYLRTMGIPLLTGRDFTDRDSTGSEKVTIISQPLANKLFPSAGAPEAIGKRLTFGVAAKDTPAQILTIIGVTADFPTSQMSTEREQLLLPLAQRSSSSSPNSITTDESGNRLPDLMLIARSASGERPEKIIAALENVVKEFNPEFRRERVITGISLRRKSMDDFLKQSAIAGATGGVILMLSALGIYGVVGLMVATRTREIAVRVALGASRPRVLSMVLFDVLKLTAPGVGVGLLLAATFVRLKGADLGISLSNVETLSYVVAAAIAILVAVLASLAPAHRAASVLPMVAMRSE
jgi:putative ABC transport system permease protein